MRRIARKKPLSRHRRNKIARPKPFARRWLEGIADELFSLLIRDARECAVCHRHLELGAAQCMHGFRRVYHSLRFDAENAFCGCASCHVRLTHDYDAWHWWLQDRWGIERYLELRSRANRVEKPDYAAVIQTLWADAAVRANLAECSEAKQRRIENAVAAITAQEKAA